LAIQHIKSWKMHMSITKEMFEENVINNFNLSLVQFKTEWNGACQIVASMYHGLESSYRGTVNFYTVDKDKEKELAERFGIVEMPAILFFKGGKVIDHAIGLIPKNVLIQKIENAISSTDN
jgi:thioredoxin 1